jgi:hypothetical protein
MTVEIPKEERDIIGSELVSIADRLRKKYKLNIPATRQLLRELLDVSV